VGGGVATEVGMGKIKGWRREWRVGSRLGGVQGIFSWRVLCARSLVNTSFVIHHHHHYPPSPSPNHHSEGQARGGVDALRAR
jgi:hypothetical protein